MPLTSVDDAYTAAAAAAVQSRTYSKNLSATLNTTDPPIHLWTFGGQPAAGSYLNTESATQITNATTGAVGFNNPSNPAVLGLQGAGGKIVTTTVTAGGAAHLVIIDQLVQYSNISATVTTLRTMTNTPNPVLPRYQDIFDVQMMAVCQTTISGTPGTVTVTFKDENGATQTTTFVLSVVSAGRICHGADYFIPLGGPKGVKQITSVQLSAAAAGGTYAMILFRVLGILPISRDWQNYSFMFGNQNLYPRTFNGCALDAILVNTSTSALAGAGISSLFFTLEK